MTRGLERVPRQAIAQQVVQFFGTQVTLMEADDVAVGGDDDRRWNRGEADGRHELFIEIGAKLERQERVLRMFDDRRMGERVAFHSRTVGAPRTGELYPQEAVGGALEEILPDPMRIYHIEHGTGSGWTPEGQARLFERIRAKGFSWIEYPEVVAWAAQMRRLNVPMIFNRENWGLDDVDLPETALPEGMPAGSAEPAPRG